MSKLSNTILIKAPKWAVTVVSVLSSLQTDKIPNFVYAALKSSDTS